ncbi:hypothetical protein [Limimaricola cinnabarinus]|uniref:hypothetical protein n=1 Tax=Limimaricola cinnabarinus TaxID=1125964 RepID=UPI002FE37CE5
MTVQKKTPKRAPMNPQYIRPARVQEVFGIHRSTLYRWAEAEKRRAHNGNCEPRLRLYKRGAMTFVKAAELESFITSGMTA